MRIRALVFDVFGTLVDWRSSVATQVTAVFAEKGLDVDGVAFATDWRARYQPSMERIRSGVREYMPLDDLHTENLMAVLQAQGCETALEPQELLDLARAWERLEPWADVPSALLRLKVSRIIAPCSNGSIALMTRLARYARLPWDCILGAELARAYKPQREVYAATCAALRLPPEQVMMVAAHNDDLAAARSAGLATAFIPRPLEYGAGQTQDLVPLEDWDVVSGNLAELVTKLDS